MQNKASKAAAVIDHRFMRMGQCENKAGIMCSSLPQTVEGGKLGEQHADNSHDGYELCQRNMFCSAQ